jgi:hypothetical protein
VDDIGGAMWPCPTVRVVADALGLTAAMPDSAYYRPTP